MNKKIMITFLFVIIEKLQLRAEDILGKCVSYPDSFHHSDLFFDRLVGICEDFTAVTVGVFIDDERVLSSYNPLRQFISDRNRLNKIKIQVAKTRQFPKAYKTLSDEPNITGSYMGISCGRPIIPRSNKATPLIHKPDHPTHDLFILKVNEKVNFTKDRATDYDPKKRKPNFSTNKTIEIGPNKVQIASPNDTIDRSFLMVAGIKLRGFSKNRTEKHYSAIEFLTYNEDDYVLVDCERYLLRLWGRFICMKMDDQMDSFYSGTMLFSNFILFGVGSFSIKRGPDGIIVFTDVRPYSEMIQDTCTTKDAFHGPPT